MKRLTSLFLEKHQREKELREKQIGINFPNGLMNEESGREKLKSEMDEKLYEKNL